LTNAGLGAWFLATAASQHPHRVFDRVRDYDPTGLLVPNWRFFAPEPAQHDFHLLYRVLSTDGEQSPWREALQIAARRWLHAVWYPDRRRDKAMFDVCTELLRSMAAPARDVTLAPAYQLLADFVESSIRAQHGDRAMPQGFQFLVARHSGHDAEHDPDYIMTSPFIPLVARAEAMS
jgi:hypothetical protein